MMEVVEDARDAGTDDRQADFSRFVERSGERLRQAFVVRYGPEVGADVHADVLARAWADWDRVSAMANPAGYLYVVGRTAARRYRRWGRPPRFVVAEPVRADDPDLFLSLGRLTEAQRVAVVLVHGYGATYQEVADLLDVPVTSVTNHVHRGLRRLRSDLEDP